MAPRSVWQEVLVICLAGVSLGAHPLLIKLLHAEAAAKSTSINGNLLFFAIELLKMIISLVLFLGTEYRRLSWKTLPSFHIIFGLFALGYALTNNMTVWITQHMDPALYQVLTNMKILTTAVAYSLLLKKPQSAQQWSALLLLVVGASLTQISDTHSATSAAGKVVETTVHGFVAVLIQTALSGLLTAASEKSVKNSIHDSMYWQNTELYLFGMGVNLGSSFLRGGSPFVGAEGAGAGIMAALLGTPDPSTYNVGVLVATVVNASFGGLLISVMLRLFSSITKAYTTCASTVFTTLISYTLLQKSPPSLLFVLGAGTVCMSICLYYIAPAVPHAGKADKKE